MDCGKSIPILGISSSVWHMKEATDTFLPTVASKSTGRVHLRYRRLRLIRGRHRPHIWEVRSCRVSEPAGRWPMKEATDTFLPTVASKSTGRVHPRYRRLRLMQLLGGRCPLLP